MTGAIHLRVDHLVQDLLDLVVVLSWYIPPGMLNRGNGGVSMGCVCTRHIFYGVKGEVEALL